MNRFVDTVKGRWVSRDLLQFTALGANLYVYVDNSPMMKLDPSGLAPVGKPGGFSSSLDQKAKCPFPKESPWCLTYAG